MLGAIGKIGATMDTSATQQLVNLLAKLRREGRQQSGLEERLVPADNAAAYSMAFLVAQALGWKIGGWKVGATKAEMQRALRATAPTYGPVYQQHILAAPAILTHKTLLSPVVEAEYAVTLAADLPPRREPYDE